MYVCVCDEFSYELGVQLSICKYFRFQEAHIVFQFDTWQILCESSCMPPCGVTVIRKRKAVNSSGRWGPLLLKRD